MMVLGELPCQKEYASGGFGTCQRIVMGLQFIANKLKGGRIGGLGMGAVMSAGVKFTISSERCATARF
jgi:hypothetical protein